MLNGGAGSVLDCVERDDAITLYAVTVQESAGKFVL